MKSSTLEPPQPFVSTSPILDIFVIWHPDDKEGALICDTLLNHYHSERFAGLAENAIEVYGRTSSKALNNSTNATIPPILTPEGTIGSTHQNYTKDVAEYSTILVFIGEHLIRSSLQTGEEWYNYLSDVLKIQQHSDKENSRTLILSILPEHLPDYSNSPIISKLLERQGVSQGNVGLTKRDTGNASVSGDGELMRDLGQAIIQNLLCRNNQQERLQVFVSHCRADIPKSDLNCIYPQGVAAKARAWINKTKLDHFFHDLQSGELWDDSIRQQVRNGALLMIRTDQYNQREWTQWEVLEAKRFNTPVVCLDATTKTQQQGSFIFDNIPTIIYPPADERLESETLNDLQGHAVIKALNLLVDISLMRKLWNHQSNPWKTISLPYSQGNAEEETHYFTSTSQLPEPTLIPSILHGAPSESSKNKHLWIMHPDPPAYPAEHDAIVNCATLAGFDRQNIHVTTPRTMALETALTNIESFPTYEACSVLNSLPDVTLGISASYSEDMTCFGLRPQHLELTISKIAQAMVMCGGKLSYAGGQAVNSPNIALRLLQETGQILKKIRLQQRRSNNIHRDEPQYSPTATVRLTPFSCIIDSKALDDIASLSRDVASYGEINVVNTDRNNLDDDENTLPGSSENKSVAHSLSTHRRSLPNNCNARLAISGKMIPASTANPDGYQGVMPGIFEESLYALREGQPLYIVGGFGGAAAILSDIVNKTNIYYGQPNLIKFIYDRFKDTFEEIEYLYNSASTGLNATDIHRLATTRRPYEVAHLLLKGLSSDSSANHTCFEVCGVS